MTTISVTPEDSALDSLQRLGEAAASGCREPGDLKAALMWGWHAVGLLAYIRLRAHRDTFDAWVADYLEEGEPEISVDRDARWDERQRLSFLELIDLLSLVDTPLLKPEFYQGWQDRTSRCHALRRRTNEILGWGIDPALRSRLLVLLAAYHRLIRLPAGVNLDIGSVRDDLPALGPLLRALVEPDRPQGSRLLERINDVFLEESIG